MLHRLCTRSVIVTLFLSSFTFNALAAENATVFEERLYVRERGAPVTETEHFRINAPRATTPSPSATVAISRASRMTPSPAPPCG